jgi:hypothetical protein
MAACSVIPILSWGRRESVGVTTIEMLKPEYEGISSAFDSAFLLFARLTPRQLSIRTNIPLILSGRKPSSQQSTLGSQDSALL